MLRTLLAALSLCLLAALPARAESAVGAQHSAWQTCLHDAYALKASLSSPALAADSALRECRDRESAYLSALSTSPLVDDEDVTRVRPALLARARLWLLGKAPGRTL